MNRLIEKKFIHDNIKRSKAVAYVKKELAKAGVIDISIQRTTLATRIGITAENPGLIIGRKGKRIQELSEEVAKNLGIENPQIEVIDVQNPDLEPKIIARWIVRQLERGVKPKRSVQRALERVIHAGAVGVEIVIKGKIAGKGAQARKERAFKGYLKKTGNMVKAVRVAQEIAILKQGIIGVEVRIVPPDVMFSDKVDLAQLEKTAKAAKTEEEKPAEKPGETKDEKTEEPESTE